MNNRDKISDGHFLIKTSVIFFAVVATAFLSFTVMASDVKHFHRKATVAAKNRQYDFAYMHYRKILRQYSNSKYAEKALFAQGEYFFMTPDYVKATAVFETFIEKYPDSKGKIFAQAYLYKIAENIDDEGLIEKRGKDIATFKQVSLVFRDRKEYKYLSGFYRPHRMVIYIDRIEFFVEGEMFAKVTYSN